MTARRILRGTASSPTVEITHADADLWVFAYGSLMWRPGFPHQDRVPARVHGYHRALCVYSHVHRGTPTQPGLVMGLDRGGSCLGLAYRVPAAARGETIDYLRAREQVTLVYHERLLSLELANGTRTRGLGYVVDQRHPQYAGRLCRDAVLDRVRRATGQSGPNPDYVLNTQAALVELGISDPVLSWLASQLTHDYPRAAPPLLHDFA